jgi:uncharacterized protein DUF3383
MATQALPLSILCDVTVSVTPAGVAVPAFNQGLIGGNSGRLPSYGANSRVALIPGTTWASSMAALGYQPTDPEYIAMGLYFDQDAPPVTPPQYGWVGCQDPTAIAAITVDSSSAGTGWKLNDTFLISQSNASFGYGQVTGVNAGAVTSVAFIPGQQGTGYSVANALTTTAQAPSTGINLEVNITAVGETVLQAITACRLANTNWYGCMWTNAGDSDVAPIAAYEQNVQPAMQYIYATTSLSALQGTTGNVFSAIKALNYGRVQGIYTSTSNVPVPPAPANVYAAAAILGIAMGLNTGAPNSAFTVAAKTLVGIQTTVLTQAQINVFAGTPGLGFGNNGNSYNNYANSYDFYYQGVNGNGLSFTTVQGLDMLAADAQISVLNVLQKLPSIPQTDAGQALILNAVRGACSRSVNRGFIAGGVWEGATLLPGTNQSLTAGTALSTGYWVGSPSFITQSSGDRALFQSMPVYVAVILAGTQQSFVIGINVQQ